MTGDKRTPRDTHYLTGALPGSRGCRKCRPLNPEERDTLSASLVEFHRAAHDLWRVMVRQFTKPRRTRDPGLDATSGEIESEN